MNMITKTFTLTAGAALAACGAADDAVQASEDKAVALEASESEATAEAVRSFVESIYRNYEGGGQGLDYSEPEAVFEPELAAAIDREFARAEQSGGIPDVGDPFCACNDYTGIEWTLGDPSLDGDMATVPVQTSLFGQTVDRVVTLKMTADGWRVYDMGVEGLDFSFREDTLSL